MNLARSIKDRLRKPRWANGNEMWDDLPPELVLVMASYLESLPITNACFALTSRRIYSILGRSVFTFKSPNSRFRFLQRLDKDGIYEAEILCPVCQVFHPPRRHTRLNTEKESSRVCVMCRQVNQRTVSPLFPSRINLDIVNFMTKGDRLMGAWRSEDYIWHKSNYTHRDNQTQLWYTLHAKVVMGHLLAKTEVILSPGTSRADSLQAVPKLLQMMNERPEVGRCCLHHSWVEVMPFVFTQDETNRAMDPHSCLWTHPESCGGRALAEEQGQWPLGLIHSCLWCFTDMTVSTFSKKDQVYVVLTSWKDLGAGKDVHDRQWQSHLDMPTLRRVYRTSKTGSIHHAFETPTGRVPMFPMLGKLGKLWTKPEEPLLPYEYRGPAH